MLGSTALKVSLRSLHCRSYNTTVLKDFVNVFRGKPTTFGSARSLYFSSKLQAFNPDWHTKGRVPTNFMSKQTLVVLHAWLFHGKLMKSGDQGIVLDEALYDEMWEDAGNWIRSMDGVEELLVNKHLKNVQFQSFQACVELDDALSYEPNEEEVLLRIGDVIWRHVYKEATDVDEFVEAFAKYIRDEYQSIQNISDNVIIEGRIGFASLPAFPTLNLTSEEELIEQKRLEHISKHGDWYEDRSMEGKPFFWNTLTGKSSWTKPIVDEVVSEKN